MSLFDPASPLAGKLRALITILSALAVGLTSLTGTFDDPHLAKVLVAINAFVALLTRFTTVGNTTEG